MLSLESFKAIDLSVFIIANIINILVSIIFILRKKKQEKAEYFIGIIVMFLALPVLAFIIVNFANNREWWTYVLPAPFILYAVIELILDYILKYDFRNTPALWPYILIYYTALMGMIGYSFLVHKTYGFITLITYFINLFATWYGHKDD